MEQVNSPHPAYDFNFDLFRSYIMIMWGLQSRYLINLRLSPSGVIRSGLKPARKTTVGPGFTPGRSPGFTLLEVMIAISIIAIALTAVLGSQSQSLSMASEAKFSTTAALLAQHKMAELELEDPQDLTSDSGDFGEDFPNYQWEVTVSNAIFPGAEEVSDNLKQIDLEISWGEDDLYQYRLRLYRFVPKDR